MADVSELIADIKELDPSELTRSLAVLAVYVTSHAAGNQSTAGELIGAEGFIALLKTEPRPEASCVILSQIADVRKADLIMRRDGSVGHLTDYRGNVVADQRAAFFPISEQVTTFFINEGGIPNLKELLETVVLSPEVQSASQSSGYALL